MWGKIKVTKEKQVKKLITRFFLFDSYLAKKRMKFFVSVEIFFFFQILIIIQPEACGYHEEISTCEKMTVQQGFWPKDSPESSTQF